MAKNLIVLRIASKVIAIIIAILALFPFYVMIALMNQPWGFPTDYIGVGVIGLYFIGLFIGLIWQGLGGIISFITSIILVILFGIELGYIMIPGILYLLSWFFQKRNERNIMNQKEV